MTDKQTFEGFDRPKQNWFKLPREWVNIVAEIDNLSELKVVQYVLAHTWGYAEYNSKKRITLDEFMNGRKQKDGKRVDRGTGLSSRSVKLGIKKAVKHGYLEVEMDGSDKARIKKYYCLKMKEPFEYEDPEDRQKQGGTIYPSDGYNLPIERVQSTHRTEKDTLERQQHKRKDVVVVSERLKNLHRDLGVETKVNNPDTLAQDLTQKYQTPEATLLKIDEKVRYYRFKIDRGKHIENPTGWVINALKTDYAETGFKTQAQLEQEQQTRETKRQQLAEITEQIDRQSQATLDTQQTQQETALSKLQAQYGTTPTDEALWQDVLSDLQTLLPKAEYLGLFSGTHLLKRLNGTAIIAVPNNFVQERLKHFQKEKIQQILSQHESKEIHPEFIVINQNAP